MSEVWLTAWQPRRPDDRDALPTLLRELATMMRTMEVITDREPLVLRTPGDDCVLIVEWRSPQDARRAQDNPSINDALARVEAAAERIPLGELEDADVLDASFEIA